jgi:uncharacterized RDD family membrane protein YckC
MGKYRRMAWATIVFIGLLGPFAALFALTWLHPLPKGGGEVERARQEMAAAGGGGGTAMDARGGIPAAKSAAGPLFAADDGQVLWVVRPVTVGEKKTAAFEVLVRANNAGVWATVRPGGAAYFETWPQGLAVQPTTSKDVSSGMAYVFGPGGRVTAFSPDRVGTMASLPVGDRLLATVGSEVGLFAMTAGARHPSTTQPGDRLELYQPLEPATLRGAGAGTQRAASRPEKGPASGPTTARTETAAAARVKAYWCRGVSWVALPELGAPGTADAPAVEGQAALAHVRGRLLAMWVDGSNPAELVVRARPDDRPGAPWSAAVRSALQQPVPAGARLLAVTLGESAVVLYPSPAGKSFALLGERIVSQPGAAGDLSLAGNGALAPMFLGAVGEGANAAGNLAVGVSENSFVVVGSGGDGVLRSAVFDSQGQPLGGPRAVAINTGNRDVQVGQQVALLLVVLLMALSLWRWRRDPRSPRLPSGMRAASIPARGAAFLIDLAIPFVAVVTAMGLWEEGGYVTILDTWQAALTKPDELFSSAPLLYVLGLYTVHVAVGELFFRRSIGKAVVGVQVLMIDGKAPTVAAVLVRNLVRLAEIVPAGILIFYMFISDYRQRLGDLMAHTIVVSPKAPDAEEKEGVEEEQAEAEEPAGRR